MKDTDVKEGLANMFFDALLKGDASEVNKMLIPAVKACYDIAAELKPLVDGFVFSSQKLKIEQFKIYLDNGFTREEALVLIASDWKAMMDALQKIKAKQ